jgi:hypothetical protein
MKREGMSVRLRFEVFKRDGFRCVYCGATPIDKPLHADHVVPVAEGGETIASNLVTACSDCNLGKAAVPLDRTRLAVRKPTQADKDQARQILEYLAIQREVERAKTKAVEVLAQRWEEVVGPLSQDMFNHLPNVMRDWPLDRIEEAMHIVARKMGTADEDEFNPYMATQQARYFHGVLRTWRTQKGKA